MAVRFDGVSGKYISVATGLPSTFTAFTWAGFINIDAAAASAGQSPGIFVLSDTFASPGKGWLLQTDTDGRTLRVWNFGQGTPVISTGVQLSTGVWYFVALAVAGTGANQATLHVYRLDNDTLATYTGTSNGDLTGAPGAAAIGSSGYSNETFNGRVAGSRIWSVALSGPERAACSKTTFVAAQSGAAVNDLPMMAAVLADNYVARSGGNWTATGVFTVEAGPPIVDGTAAATDARDTAAVSGAVGVAGTLAATDPASTAALSGSVGVAGTLAATDPANTAALAGSVGLTGTLAATAAGDTAAIAGTIGGVVTGALAATEARDSAAAAGVIGGVAAPVGGGAPDDDDWEPAGPHAVPAHRKPGATPAAPRTRRKRQVPAALEPVAVGVPEIGMEPVVPWTPPQLPEAARETFAQRAMRLVMLVDTLEG